MILMYHKVFIESPTKWWVLVTEFYRQMVELQSKQIVYLDDYDRNNPEHVVITFDGVYENVLTYAAPILRKFNYPFELFVTSDYIGNTNQFDVVEPHCEFASVADLKELCQFGGRIQWHTRSHPDMLVILDESKIKEELSIPVELKVEFGDKDFKWFAYPYGRFNDLVLNKIKDSFSGALSCDQGDNENIYCLNRITVLNSTAFVNKKLSAIIVSHNYGAYLNEAIESVISQTVPANEILILDDASEDNTSEVADYYQKKYPELIRFIRNETNLGIVDSFNKAVSNTRGEYLIFLGADNRFLSNYFETCLTEFYKDDLLDVVYTDFVLFGSRASLEYTKFNESYRGEIKHNSLYVINFPEFEKESDAVAEMELRNFVHGSSMYTRDSFNKVGGYLSKVGHPEDYDLFKRILQIGGRLKKAKKTYLEYRQHSKSQANNRTQLESKLSFYLIKVKSLEKENEYLRRFEKIYFIGFLEKLYVGYFRFRVYIAEQGFFAASKKLLKRLLR